MSSPGILLLRADASEQMGTGHLMRCLALAQYWRERGGEAALATRCRLGPLLERFRSEGVNLIEPKQDAESLSEAREILSLANDLKANWAALDGYHFSADYQESLTKDGRRVLLIDDNGHAGRYSADLVVDQNLTANEKNYRQRRASTRLLLGTEYVLLRREFRKRRPDLRRRTGKKRNLLVSMGGSDPENVTAKVLRAVNHCAEVEVRVVIGSGNAFCESLRKIAGKASSPTRLESGADMAELMSWADFAISAAGATLWELAYMGVPTLTVELVDHQRPIAAAFEKAGAGMNLGWHAALQNETINSAIKSLLGDGARLEAMSSKGRALVDGYGPQRVFNAMVQQR